MQFDIDKDKLTRFIKSGIIVLSLILVLGAGFYFVPQIIAKASGSSRKLPIYCVDCKEPKVSLSFDAAWGNEDTKRILEILAKHEVKVTFFMTGGWVEKFPEDVKAIAAAGHDLGNHSENHKQMSKLSAEQCTKEIMDVHDKVKALTGVDMTLFRPPYGDYNNRLIETVNACKYHCIQWDVDIYDITQNEVNNKVESLLERVITGVKMELLSSYIFTLFYFVSLIIQLLSGRVE